MDETLRKYLTTYITYLQNARKQEGLSTSDKRSLTIKCNKMIKQYESYGEKWEN